MFKPRHLMSETVRDVVDISNMPPELEFDNETEELNYYTRSPFLAYTWALKHNRHHPRIWKTIKGSVYERDYCNLFNLKCTKEGLLLKDADESYYPDPYTLRWFTQVISMIRQNGLLQFASTGHVYQIDHVNRVITLQRGNPKHPWHTRTCVVFDILGYTVRDGRKKPPPEPPTEMTVTEKKWLQHNHALLEELEEFAEPRHRINVIVLYRPFFYNTRRRWAWFVVTEDYNEVLAYGQATTRAEATIMAQQAVTDAGGKIIKIELLEPYD